MIDPPSWEWQHPADPRPLSRHRGWQWLSIGMIVAGAILALGSVGLRAAAVQVPRLQANPDVFLVLLEVGAGLLLIGCLTNLARAIVVRRRLPAMRYRGGSVLIMLLLAGLVATAVEIPFTADVMALTSGHGQMSQLGTLVLLTVLQVTLIVIAALFVFRPQALAGARLFPRASLARSVLTGIGWGIPAWIVASLLAAVVSQLLRLVNIEPQPQVAEEVINLADPFIAVLATVVIAPIAEEIFFRGVALNAWVREYGVKRAIIGSALLFALIHGSLAALVPIFVLGLVLAIIYLRNGNLASAIALHATFNGISVLLALLVRFGVFQIPN